MSTEPVARRLTRLAALAAMAVLSLALVACNGGDEDPAATPTPGANGTPANNDETATPTPTNNAEGSDPTPQVYRTPEPGEGPRTGGEIGREATDEDIEPINIDITPGGENLPEGSGTVQEGSEVYAMQCARCHGADGTTEDGIGPRLVSEPGPWEPGMPVTIGSYWPYAETVFDYIRRAMPFDQPGTLSDDEVYAVVAWLLYENQIVDVDAEMNAETLPQVEMPNRDNFFPCWPDECRPDVSTE